MKKKRIRKRKWKNTKPISTCKDMNEYLNSAIKQGMERSKEAGVRFGPFPKDGKSPVEEIIKKVEDVLDELNKEDDGSPITPNKD